MAVLSIMLSSMILSYCQNQCQTAKQITRWVKSIKTLITSLWNVILHFACHLNKHTMQGSDSWLRLCGCSAGPPPFLSCCHAELLLFSATQLLYLVVQIQKSGCSCSNSPTLLLGQDACMLSNCNWEQWTKVLSSLLEKGAHDKKQKQRANVFEFKFTASLICTNSWANS